VVEMWDSLAWLANGTWQSGTGNFRGKAARNHATSLVSHGTLILEEANHQVGHSTTLGPLVKWE
jgi:hypothetical protein